MTKNLIIIILFLAIIFLLFSLINYDDFQKFSYPTLVKLEKSLDFLIAKSKIIEDLLYPLKKYISEIISKIDKNSKIKKLYRRQIEEKKEEYILPYKEGIDEEIEEFDEDIKSVLSEKSTKENKVVEERYVLLTLINNFKVKGKLLSENLSNYTIELDGLPVEFSSTEINSVRYLSKEEYQSLTNIVNDKENNREYLP